MKRLTDERVKHLRTSAEVGIRMSSLHPHTVQVVPEDLAALLDEVIEGRNPRASRVLSKEERRLAIEALRAAANETRRAKSAAVSDLSKAFTRSEQTHVDELSRRAGSQDRLASELGEYDLRLERAVS